MGFTIGQQVLSLGSALLLGVAVGFFYDSLRVLRGRLPLLGGPLDLLFWMAVTCALFCHALVREGGVVRIYLVAGVFGGAWCYFRLLSPPVFTLVSRLADGVAALFRLLTLPFRMGARLCKKIGTAAKKSFHYRRKWYRINLLMREMDDGSRKKGRGGGKSAYENQTSQFADQNRSFGPAGGGSDGGAGSSEPDRGGGGPEG